MDKTREFYFLIFYLSIFRCFRFKGAQTQLLKFQITKNKCPLLRIAMGWVQILGKLNPTRKAPILS